MFVNEIMPKLCSKFYCEKCDYGTSKKSSYSNHLISAKHQKSMVVNEIMPKLCSKYVCDNCSKIYKDNSGLWRHKQKCIANSNKSLMNENKTLKEFMLEQNQDFKNLIIELLKKETINNQVNNNINNISNNISNCNNKAFNLNFFLNEQCKDALNINEFVESIKMNLSDLEEFAHIGYADGVSNIFVKGINALDINKRPIHCSDAKREVLYIKNNDIWVKETEDKPLVKDAIKKVAFKNIRQINEWVKDNPRCKDPTTKQFDKYNQIVMNSMSGVTEQEQKDNIEKIVRNVTKAVTIDKYSLK